MNIFDSIKNRFNSYKSYYQMLDINPKNVTDEIVKEKYDNKIYELEKIFKNCDGKEYQEVKKMIKEALNDAYSALKSEHSRTNYNELLEGISNSNNDKITGGER